MKLNFFGMGIVVVVGGLAGGLLFPDPVHAQSEEEQQEESRWNEGKSKSLILTRRADNGAYGTSAFSFQTETQDLGVHLNNVDLVFNGCGLLHFNPVGGMKSRVADLGEAELNVEFDEDEQRDWAEKAFYPKEGHVYWHEVKTRSLTMTVKFRIDELERDEMAISWVVVKEPDGFVRRGSMSGTMGQCGGQHSAR